MFRISAVSYLNTAPFIYGIEHSGLLKPGEFEIQRDIPSHCASRLMRGDAEIGIVPVAVLPRLSNFKILGRTCIGATDHIDSVMLFSQVPLEEIREIILDWHSRTSANLCRILAGEYWNIQPDWIHPEGDFMHCIQGKTAALVIGDRALAHAGSFPYSYDLAKEWNRFTGLPFVFACWVSKTDVPEEFLHRFEQSLHWGLNKKNEVAVLEEMNYPSGFQVKKYLEETVSYNLDSAKLKAMETFLSLSGKLSQYTPA